MQKNPTNYCDEIQILSLISRTSSWVSSTIFFFSIDHITQNKKWSSKIVKNSVNFYICHITAKFMDITFTECTSTGYLFYCTIKYLKSCTRLMSIWYIKSTLIHVTSIHSVGGHFVFTKMLLIFEKKIDARTRPQIIEDSRKCGEKKSLTVYFYNESI